MSQGSETGFAQREPVPHPLLIECDSAGKVLWISQRTRQVFGEPEHLTELIMRQPAEDGARFQVFTWQLWSVWESRETVLLALYPPQGPDRACLELAYLERRFSQKFFRLLRQERRLAECIRRGNRKGGGRAAIRQIELERQRLGRDLHTGVGQALAAIRLQREIISAECPLPPVRIKQALDTIGALTEEALDQVRSVSRRLHPPAWQRLTLAVAIQQLWRMSGIPERFNGVLRISELPQDPVPEVKALVYRSMQEAFSNLVRHSKATKVEARLNAAGERLILTIEDNGVGFDVERLTRGPSNVAAGIGLRSIQEQAEGLGGNFDVESSPLGTKLVVSVMLAPR